MNYLTNLQNINLDDNTTNLHLYILDPLSVIIKLAIISNKPVGTKIRIDNNIIVLQEPGPFQALCRYIFKSNKTDIQYLYNPIELACKHYLTKHVIQQYPKIKDLFKCAQNGITKLAETYKNCSIMRFSFNYYFSIISNYLDEKNDETLFKRDHMTPFYNVETIEKMNRIWNAGRIKIVLNLTTFLSDDTSAELNVKSLETIMEGVDVQVSQTIHR